MCQFCRRRFYDSSDLYKHMESEHEHCFLCRRERPGQYVYYRHYKELEGGWQLGGWVVAVGQFVLVGAGCGTAHWDAGLEPLLPGPHLSSQTILTHTACTSQPGPTQPKPPLQPPCPAQRRPLPRQAPPVPAP